MGNWRRKRSSANQSRRPIPCYRGKIQGILTIPNVAADPAGVSSADLEAYSQIPCETEQAISERLTGNPIAETGKTSRQSAIRDELGLAQDLAVC